MSGKQSKTGQVASEAEAIADRLGERAEMVRERVADFDGQVRDVIQTHPLACLAGAVATGYLVGRLVARR